MNPSPRRHRPWWLLLLVLQLAAIAAPLPARAGAAPADPDPHAALLPEVRDRVARATGDLDRYRIDARLFPEAGETGHVAGEAAVTFTNRTGGGLDEIWFRLLPNAPYLDTELVVEKVRVAERWTGRHDLDLSRDGTALRVPLAGTLAPGAAVEIVVAFFTELSWSGMPGRNNLTETWLLESWHPIVAPWDAGTGWWLEPLSALDDFPGYDAAYYDVTFTAPVELKVVTPGVAVDEATPGDLRRRRYLAGPVRDFAIVADDDMVSVAATVAGTRLTAYAEPGDLALAQRTLRSAEDAFAAFSDRFGPYPYRRLDLFQYAMPGAYGFAVSGMVFLDGSLLAERYLTDLEEWGAEMTADDEAAAEEYAEDFLLDAAEYRALVAHEVAHQWWGVSTQGHFSRHSFLIEGLAEYSANAFVRWTDGGAEADRQLIATARLYLDVRDYGDDWVVDRSDDGALFGIAQSGIVYAKAAVGFHAIRNAIGDAAFADALAAYNAEFAFRTAAPADLLAAFEAASGDDLSSLWRFWFESDDVELADVRAVVAGR